MDILTLETAVKKSWNNNTCYPKMKNNQSNQNPSLGQCAVTALIVQDFFGGEIVYCSHNDHYRNRLSDGSEIDFTKDQFPQDTLICIDSIVERNAMLKGSSAIAAQTNERYEILKREVNDIIATGH